MNIAPIHIHPLLEIYALVRNADCHYVGANTDTRMTDLIRVGLIGPDPRVPPPGEPEPHGWVVTPKGVAFIEALLDTPMPVQVWEVPR